MLQRRAGKYASYEDIPRRIPHDEMEAAKSKFRVEVYFLVTLAIMVTALWVGYLSKSEKVILVKLLAYSDK